MEFVQEMAKSNAILVNHIVKPAGSAKIMSSADDISSWYEAVQYYEAGSIDEAIDKFKSVKQSAKMLLNLACCHLRKNELKTAEEILTKAVTGDPHLALGFFMLGLTHYIQDNFKESLTCFEKTFTLLRGNRFVDYRQLGFQYQLYSCEVLTNTAAVHSKLHDIDKAKVNLLQAFEAKAEKKHERIFDAIQELHSNKPIELFVPPRSEIFRPSKAAVANIKKKDYLGTSKVISTDSEEDCYACFSGIKEKVNEQKKLEHERKLSRASIFADLKSGNRRKTLRRALTQEEDELDKPKECLGVAVDGKKQRRVSLCPPASALPRVSPASSLERLDAVDGGGIQRRAMTCGARPNKALPKLQQIIDSEKTASKQRKLGSIPGSPQIDFDTDLHLLSNPFSPEGSPTTPTLQLTSANQTFHAALAATTQSSPPLSEETRPSHQLQRQLHTNENEIEIEVQFSFIKKVRLLKGFSLADLQTVAVQQTLPTQLEFRSVDILGRQTELKDGDELNSVLTGLSAERKIIQCFPKES